MDINTLTLKDFTEFAEVYPYTQDRYMMEKMFMELNLMKLHMESYKFLLEQGDISLSQLDVLMVESGVNDRAPATEKLYCEKSKAILTSIKRMLEMVTKSLLTLFRNVGGVFISKDEHLAEVITKNGEQATKIKNTQWTDKLDKSDTDELKRIITKISEDLKKFISIEGPKILPCHSEDNESAVWVVINAANTISTGGMDSKSMKMYTSFCMSKYEVEGLATVANLESILDKVDKVIDEIKALNSDNADEISKFTANTDRVKSEVDSSCRTNKKFTMGEEALKKKLKAVENLERISGKIEDSEDDMNPEYLRSIHELVVSLQTAAAEAAKALSSHVQMRKSILSAHAILTNKIDVILNKQD